MNVCEGLNTANRISTQVTKVEGELVKPKKIEISVRWIIKKNLPGLDNDANIQV